MRWHDLLFMHWPLRPAVLHPHIPPALALDTFDGWAWLGVVPFRMSRVRPRYMPALPWGSAFPELNVRTYVTAGAWYWPVSEVYHTMVANGSNSRLTVTAPRQNVSFWTIFRRHASTMAAVC